MSPPQPPELLPPDSREAREENWQRMSEYFDEVSAGQKIPIEDGVRDAVIGLNIHGVITNASDEGHAERLHAAPWIQFTMSDDEDLHKLAIELDIEADMLHAHDPNDPKLARIAEEASRRNREYEAGKAKVFQQVGALLSEFYQGRTINNWNSVLKINGFERTITPNGALIQPSLDEEQRRRNLEEYQEEMQAFGAFLKLRYLEGV